MSLQVKATKSISMPELKDKLMKIQKRDKELSFRSGKTLDYLNNINLIDLKSAKAIKKELEEQELSRITENVINKIIDIMPQTEEEIKSILQGFNITPAAATLKAIQEIICKYK